MGRKTAKSCLGSDRASLLFIFSGEMYTVDGHYWNASYGEYMIEEESDRLCDWKFNPMAALPQWLSICI